MEANKDISKQEESGNTSTEAEILQLAKLYMSTSETLAKYAYEATVIQQQMNMLAQQVTANSVRMLLQEQ